MDPGGASTRQMARPPGTSVQRVVGSGDQCSSPMADTLQGTGLPLGPWGPGVVWGPPTIPVTFNRNLDPLAMFLSQVISHLDRYACFYPSQWAMVVAIMAGLQGEAVEWAADLYSDHARELADAGLFLEALRSRFEDVFRVQQTEAEILVLKQRGRSPAEYIRDFRRPIGRLQSWPECLLVHQFRAGLCRDLRQACVSMVSRVGFRIGFVWW